MLRSSERLHPLPLSSSTHRSLLAWLLLRSPRGCSREASRGVDGGSRRVHLSSHCSCSPDRGRLDGSKHPRDPPTTLPLRLPLLRLRSLTGRCCTARPVHICSSDGLLFGEVDVGAELRQVRAPDSPLRALASSSLLLPPARLLRDEHGVRWATGAAAAVVRHLLQRLPSVAEAGELRLRPLLRTTRSAALIALPQLRITRRTHSGATLSSASVAAGGRRCDACPPALTSNQ